MSVSRPLSPSPARPFVFDGTDNDAAQRVLLHNRDDLFAPSTRYDLLSWPQNQPIVSSVLLELLLLELLLLVFWIITTRHK